MKDKRKIRKKISPETSGPLKRSDQFKGLNISKFVINDVSETTHQIISQSNIIQLSPEDQVKFAIALIDPPKPSDALERAFSIRQKIIFNA